jgi:hypothetical protein
MGEEPQLSHFEDAEVGVDGWRAECSVAMDRAMKRIEDRAASMNFVVDENH